MMGKPNAPISLLSKQGVIKPILKLDGINKQIEDPYDNIKLRNTSIPYIPSDYSLYDDLHNIKQSLQQLLVAQSEIKGYTYSAAGGSDSMSDELKEIKVKVNDIDRAVQTLNTTVAVLENTVKLRFDSVDSTLKEIKESLKDSVTSKRFNITTGIVSIGAVSGIITLILKIFTKSP